MIAATKTTTRIKIKAVTVTRVAARMGNKPANGQKATASNNSKVVTGPMDKDQKAATGRKVAGVIAHRAITGPMATASNTNRAVTAPMGSRPGQGRKVAAAIASRAITTGVTITARGQIIQTTINHETIIRPSLNR